MLFALALVPDALILSWSRRLSGLAGRPLFIAAYLVVALVAGGIAGAIARAAVGLVLARRAGRAPRLWGWIIAAVAAFAIFLPQVILFDHYRLTGCAPFTGDRLGSSHTLQTGLVSLAAAIIVSTAAVTAARALSRRVGARVLLVAGIACGAIAFAALRATLHSFALRAVVFNRMTLTGWILGRIDLWWDWDGDTFAPAWLGGGDPDDRDPEVHPLALWSQHGGSVASPRSAPTAAIARLERLNILLISDDTLRPDHLGCYGYRVATSRAIDGLAGGGVLFERCLVPQPKTSPGLASLLTGKPPGAHHVRLIGQKLDPSHLTLAEILAAYGYATCGITRNGVVSATFGFDQGFHRFLHVAGRRESAATDSAFAWLEARAGTTPERPFFLWLHYLDPHGPYDEPRPYSESHSGATDAQLLRDRYPQRVSRWQIPPYQRRSSTRVADYIRSYNGEISSVDREVRRLLDWLDERDLARETLIVFTSDHGESFTEHDYYFEHGEVAYDDNVRVPLILRLPGVLPSGKRIAAQVSLIDVVPTILDLLEIPRLPGPEGASLLGMMLGREEPRDRPLHILANYVGAYSPRYFTNALCDGRWKLIYVPEFHILELYDLVTDPLELANLWGRWDGPQGALRREAGMRLRADLARRMMAARAGRRPEAPKITEMSRDLIEQLRSLGYIN